MAWYCCDWGPNVLRALLRLVEICRCVNSEFCFITRRWAYLEDGLVVIGGIIGVHCILYCGEICGSQD